MMRKACACDGNVTDTSVFLKHALCPFGFGLHPSAAVQIIRL